MEIAITRLVISRLRLIRTPIKLFISHLILVKIKIWYMKLMVLVLMRVIQLDFGKMEICVGNAMWDV